MSNSNVDPKLIESMPQALMRTLPAAQPPPGIQPNFSAPPTRVPVILGVGIAFLVLAVVCFSIRIYTKIAMTKNWKWDDLTCSLGFMCSIVYFAAVVMGCTKAAAGRHMWDVYLSQVLHKYGLYQDYITTIMVTPALGLIKFSLFIQYYLLFRPLRWVRITVWIGATISVTFYVVVTITAFVLNSPWPGESLLEGILSWHYIKFSQFSIPTGVIGMLVDWYLLILPVPAVMTLQMSIAKKIGVLIVFMTGGLAAIASILSLYYRVQLQRNLSDASWHVSYVLLWAQVEMFAGVAASSMPTVKQFFSRQKFSITSWRSALRSSLTHLIGNTTREKIPEHNSSFEAWGGNNMHTATASTGFGMENLESGGGELKAARALRAEDSQILLSHDISIVQGQLSDGSFKPVTPGYRH